MSLLYILPPFSRLVGAVFDAFLLSVLVFPMLYFFLWKPMTFHIAERVRSEEELQNYKENLEITVNERTIALRKAINNLKGEIKERKRAEMELQKSREQLRTLTAHVQNVREDERKKVARDIHDELGQALTILTFDLSWIEEMLNENQQPIIDKTRKALELVTNAIQKVREISSELRPTVLDDLGIVAAIDWQANKFQDRTGIICSVAFEPDKITLDEELATEVFRIFQETLTNVARHAEASSVNVNLKLKDDKLLLKVIDNGKGITEQEINDPKSVGLTGMKERLHPWKGTVEITGLPEKGTTMTVVVSIA